MSVYFCSDLHIGHPLAARLRGFKSVDEHDEAVIDSIAGVSDKRTVIWVLGDVCMRRDKMPMLSRILGRKRLVRGNHDNFDMGDYLAHFEEIHGFLRYKKFWLSHCPIHPQEMYRCAGNIHGHIHRNTNSMELPLPYFNVNWDFLRGPIHLDEIKKSFA